MGDPVHLGLTDRRRVMGMAGRMFDLINNDEDDKAAIDHFFDWNREDIILALIEYARLTGTR